MHPRNLSPFEQAVFDSLPAEEEWVALSHQYDLDMEEEVLAGDDGWRDIAEYEW